LPCRKKITKTMAGHRNKRRNQKYSNKEIEMTRAFNEKIKLAEAGR